MSNFNENVKTGILLVRYWTFYKFYKNCLYQAYDVKDFPWTWWRIAKRR